MNKTRFYNLSIASPRGRAWCGLCLSSLPLFAPIYREQTKNAFRCGFAKSRRMIVRQVDTILPQIILAFICGSDLVQCIKTFYHSTITSKKHLLDLVLILICKFYGDVVPTP